VNEPQALAGARAAVAVGLAIVLAIAAPAASGGPNEESPDAAARDPDYAAAKAATARRDWPEAVSRFRKALLRDPDNADLHNHLGYAHRNLRQFDLAFKHYEQALAISPRHRGAHEYIGEAYLMTGNLSGAEKHLAALREICLLPCEELTDLEKAIAAFRAAPATARTR
jgi:tetratricopeptide (TPR) repeat protein